MKKQLALLFLLLCSFSCASQKKEIAYSFNDRQQLNSRSEKYWDGSSWAGFTESFTFDALNRLETASVNGVEKMQMVYTTDGTNNQIWSKTGVGSNFQYNYGSGYPVNSKLRELTAAPGYIPNRHDITYTPRLKVGVITEHVNLTQDRVLNVEYGIDNQRFKQTYTDEAGAITQTWYSDGYEEIMLPNGTARKLNYIYAGDDLIAINVQSSDSINGTHYVHTDYLGSLRCITNASGTVEHRLSFDAWGNRRDPITGELTDTVPSGLFTARGFTGHEHLPEFNLINMNGRMYDPILARFLSPDPFIQTPDFSQSFNRYSYCLNNPLSYIDPSGEIAWFIPVIIGAVIGAYSGGVMANDGQYNPTKWDYQSGKTWGYMLGGAVVGGVSGYAGWAIAGSGIPMANTAAIAASSLINSAGTWVYTGGQTPISVSLGVASYDFTNGTFGYLGKKGNSILENIGYTFGALANLSDAVSLFSGGGQNVKVNSAKTDAEDWWGHSSITDENGDRLVSFGPDSRVQKAASLSETWENSIKGAKLWDTYLGEKGTWSVELNNVSTKALNSYASGVTRWDLLLNSCVGHTTRALWSAGVPTLYLFHPHLLNAQLFIRQLGIYSSPYLYQIPKK